MTWTRWKLLAGVLGLSIGGLAATCQEPNSRKCHAPPDLPKQTVSMVPTAPALPAAAAVQVTLPPPVAVAAPLPADAPQVAPVKLAEPPPLPVTPPPVVDLSPKPIDLPALAVKADAPKPVELPALDLPAAPPPKVETPAAPALPKLDLAPPTVAPEPPKVEKPVTPDPLLTAPPKPDVAAPSPKVPARPTAAPPADLPPLEAPAPTLAVGVRVTLRLGDGRPNFDVLQGGDCLLKVVCERVEVKSVADKAEPVALLRGAGGVRFSSPGCEGTCDALAVQADTGEVELTGSVRVRFKEGKGNTEMTGGTMRFKLGTAPAYSVSDPGVLRTTFVPTGGTR